MSNAEHYFENLIYHDKDVLGEPNKKGLSQEVIDAIEICYYYVVYNMFGSREYLDEYLLKEHHFDRIKGTHF